MAPAARAIGRTTACCVAVVAGFAGVTSCAVEAPACAGQCAPPYELQVNFRQGTPAAQAEKVLTSCAHHNPVVIGIGAPSLQGGTLTGWVYTRVFGTKRTDGLFKCLQASGVTFGVAWPD